MGPVTAALAGRYRIVRQLGAGGMGRVWLAHDEHLHRDVALKELVIADGMPAAERERAILRVRREARAIGQFDNPHVVRLLGVENTEAGPWIVMEYIPSRSLQQVIEEEGRLDPRRVAAIGLDVLDALVAAHRAAVLHRDVKPGNILLGDDGRVVLTDFGIATVAGDPAITLTGQLVLSPEYAAPERARYGAASPAADLWSLGATLYAAVEGRSPFARGSTMETLLALVSDPPPAAPHAGPLRPALEGLLRKEPEQRVDAGTARTLLEAAAGRAPATPAVPTPPAPPAAPAVPAPPAEAAPSAVSAAPAVSVPSAAVSARPAEPVEGARDAVVGAAPVPGPARAARGRVRRVLMALLAALLLASGVTWYTLVRPDSHRGGSPSTGTGSTAASTTSPGASPSRTPGTPAGPGRTAPAPAPTGPTPLVLPAGWQMYHDSTGFSVAAPTGWRMTRDGTIVYWREGTGEHRVLGIDQSRHPKSDPVADWTHQESVRLAGGDWTDYHRIRIVKVDYFRVAADWDFTYAGSSGTVRVRNRGFVTSDTQAYAIYWSTPAADWDANFAYFQLIAASFQPRR